MARAKRPVEKVIAIIYFHCTGLTSVSVLISPEIKTKASAKKGVIPKRTAVVCSDETFVRLYFERAVDTPQLAAAPIARSAAMSVPFPVPKFTVRSGKETKYAAIRAVMAYRNKR